MKTIQAKEPTQNIYYHKVIFWDYKLFG